MIHVQIYVTQIATTKTVIRLQVNVRMVVISNIMERFVIQDVRKTVIQNRFHAILQQEPALKDAYQVTLGDIVILIAMEVVKITPATS